ncbi:hypothetical protein LTR04_006819, partial [Oleoguttula sp. CCFEE 6159]
MITPTEQPISVYDFAHQRQSSMERRPPLRQASHDYQPDHDQPHVKPPQRPSHQPSVERHQRKLSVDQIPYRQPHEQHHYARHDPSEDQENMPPPTFKRNKESEFKMLGIQKVSIHADNEKPRMAVIDTPVPVQPSPRKALAALSENAPHPPTPHRRAPPPPKMSVLETATATAGASTTKTKRKRTHVIINNKVFTQMGKIGKGGSSDVYRIMAENYKIFALKKVHLADCDESAVRGYKGEIDLLKRLENVDRVVRLFDWELNEQTQSLSVLMEMGESDLNRILQLRLGAVDARFDVSFTRFYWKEMLECVQAVHAHDIVHSDLKPANFLLVQGRLKLIDFGIANAIEVDHTVNVHRDSHVGTPNYMSPESITDTNAAVPGSDNANKLQSDGRAAKMMKLGKPSDVWSLGCILYQMTYGRPPFAHIANQISRILAITNPSIAISFPATGIGAVALPPGLKATLRRCLQRDPAARPSVDTMLNSHDAFLDPDAAERGVVISEELLGQIIGRVVERCGDQRKGFPTSEE